MGCSIGHLWEQLRSSVEGVRVQIELLLARARMEEEVVRCLGQWGQQPNYRHGTQGGWLFRDGRKENIQRPAPTPKRWQGIGAAKLPRLAAKRPPAPRPRAPLVATLLQPRLRGSVGRLPEGLRHEQKQREPHVGGGQPEPVVSALPASRAQELGGAAAGRQTLLIAEKGFRCIRG